MGTIFHITTHSAWKQAVQSGAYIPASLVSEGFIHCSTRDQVILVANQFYRARPELVLLCIDESKVESDIRYEAPAEPHPDINPSALFPHIYGELNLEAVFKTVEFNPDPDGHFSLPPDPLGLT